MQRRKTLSTPLRTSLVAIKLGILLGYYYPETAVNLKPLGDGFIKLIKMILAPIIFCTVVTGIAGMQALDKVGRVGIKALLYFEVVSTLALAIGLLVIHILQPGVGMNVDASALDTNSLTAYTEGAKHHGAAEFLLNIIPTTVIDAFAKGEYIAGVAFFIAVRFFTGSHEGNWHGSGRFHRQGCTCPVWYR